MLAVTTALISRSRPITCSKVRTVVGDAWAALVAYVQGVLVSVSRS